MAYSIRVFLVYFAFAILSVVTSQISMYIIWGDELLSNIRGWIATPIVSAFLAAVMTVINHYRLKRVGIDTAHLKSADLRPVQTEMVRAACSPDEALEIIQERLTGRVKQTADNVIEIKTWNFWSPWLGYKTILEFMPRTADSPGRVRINSRSALRLHTMSVDLSGGSLVMIHKLKRLLC